MLSDGVLPIPSSLEACLTVVGGTGVEPVSSVCRTGALPTELTAHGKGIFIQSPSVHLYSLGLNTWKPIFIIKQFPTRISLNL